MKLLVLSLNFLIFSGSIVAAQSYEMVQDEFPSGIQVERLGGTLGVAPTEAQARPLTPLALGLIKQFEGWREKPYNDAVGYCTIGFGHLLALKSCEEIELGEFKDGISISEGERILLADTLDARAAVQDLVEVDLTDDQFGALVSFTFNLGRGKLSTSTLLRLLNLGSYQAAEKQFYRWTRAKGIVLSGLVARRNCEAFKFRGEFTQLGISKFDRQICEDAGLGVAPGILVNDIDVLVGE
ncbi:MAG: lysozyme [Paracoccaceae bacterium]